MEDLIKKLGILFIILAAIAMSSLIVAVFLSFAGNTSLTSGNVAVIPITGVIANAEDAWTDYAQPDTIVAWIDDANNDPTIKAIVFEINSPGGSPVASDEIAQAIMRANKTTVAYIRDMGASGAYWIASSTDHIIANRMSLTGSVGVTGSYIEWAGTLRRYNATYRQFKAGEYKEIGNPFADASLEEQQVYQAKIDRLQEFFIQHVREERNLTTAQVKSISTGEPFLGVEALPLGLVDELGSKAELDAYLMQKLGEKPTYSYYEKPSTLIEQLGLVKSSAAPSMEQTIASEAAYSGAGLRT